MAPVCCPAKALMLMFAGLLAVGLGSPEPDAPSGNRAREEPPPENELPAGSAGRPLEPSSERAHSIDPRDAWMLFVRQSDRGVNSKRGSRGKARKLKLGLPGPPGPPGPQGPPGPIIPPEVLLKEFQLLLKVSKEAPALLLGSAATRLAWPDTEGAFRRGPGLNLTSGQYNGARRRLLRVTATLQPLAEQEAGATTSRGPPAPVICIQSQCQHNGTHPPLRVKFMRVILSIFLWHTGSEGTRFPLYPGTELVSRRRLAIPGFGPGLPFLALVAHLRLCGLNFLLLGTQFRCTSTRRPSQDSPSHGTLLGVGSWGDVSTWWVELVGLGQGSLADPLSVGHSSLEAVTGLESSSELFTVSVNGVLYLQTGQYTSVFLDNASGSSLTVRSGSHFSGVLLGV
ncbi:Erythroferrone [Camelus dromedarius]|uniref:Erythroferrone n=1 Tax=Camelus dromedarius TaxID=9838 RepID=A0A5N4E848_CAMDR|nr:Erythroferrone [Camelus dromedarius]